MKLYKNIKVGVLSLALCLSANSYAEYNIFRTARSYMHTIKRTTNRTITLLKSKLQYKKVNQITPKSSIATKTQLPQNSKNFLIKTWKFVQQNPVGTLCATGLGICLIKVTQLSNQLQKQNQEIKLLSQRNTTLTTQTQDLQKKTSQINIRKEVIDILNKIF